MAIPAEDPNRPSGARADDRDARNWAVAAHLAWLVTFAGVPPPIGPLVVWLVKRNDHPFVDDQAREALNFQLSILIYAIVGALLAVVLGIATLGVGFLAVIPVAIAFGLVVLILPIVAAVRASEGDRYRYPLTLRLVT